MDPHWTPFIAGIVLSGAIMVPWIGENRSFWVHLIVAAGSQIVTQLIMVK